MIMEKEFKKTIDVGGAAMSQPESEVSPAAYLHETKELLAKGRRGEAYRLLQLAVVKYDEDPFLLSYFGYLTALLEGKYRNGIESCKLAIVLLEKKFLRGTEDVEERLNAVLYLNLGKAYLAAGKKKDAVDTLQKGLHFDKQNKDLQKELEILGIRKYIPVPFLDRSNMINEFLGRLLRKPDKNMTH
jgi:tetratricopeptide (TPR) repeat protein